MSGASAGETCHERLFAHAYADYHGVPYCTPTTSGTASLTLALRALGVGPGDEVLVPGLTWVACAAAVLAVGAVPVLVDIEEDTLAMSPVAAKDAITDRTQAMLVVHPFCTLARLDDFLALSAATGIALIEDCAQAHGATWRGQRVGTFGAVGCFSMQQSKVLTSGEGGACITRRSDLHRRLEQLRLDGRMFLGEPVPAGTLELVEVGDVQGTNLCLSELQAAVLHDRLNYLDGENAHRAERAATLERLLQGVEGVGSVVAPPGVTSRTYYNFVIRIDPDLFGGHSVDSIARALAGELNTAVFPIYRPMNRHPLYQPLRAAQGNLSVAEWLRRDPARFWTPVAEQARATCLTLTHPVLLDDDASMEDVLTALLKVQALAEQLGDVVVSARQAF